jgi:hypothetical protein
MAAEAPAGPLDSRRVEHPGLGTLEIRRLDAGEIDRFVAFLEGLSEASRH